MSNLTTEGNALAAVAAYEQERGRSVAPAPRGSGYDLTSVGSDGERHIEVKSTAQPFLTERWLEPLEYERFKLDLHFWVYAVVDCAGSPRVVEFDREDVAARYVGEVAKHMLRFRRSHFNGG